MIGRLSGALTSFVAACVEAWHELRIHKLRVLLSLFGVMLAVASLTTTMAAASIGRQIVVEGYESQGRPATLSLTAYDPSTGASVQDSRIRPAVMETAERFGITHVSAFVSQWGIPVELSGRRAQVELVAVDAPYATMFRVKPQTGRWLEERDAQNRSPAVLVDQGLLRALGQRNDGRPFTLEVGRDPKVAVTVIGTIPDVRNPDGGRMYVLWDAYNRWFAAADPSAASVEYRAWVPPEGADVFEREFSRALASELGSSSEAQAYRIDYGAYEGSDRDLLIASLVVGGIAGLILLLGALSLLNVSLVTMQQRIREVGVRRSFGATTGRIFFSVMMESVVATFVAGTIGVLLSVAIVNSPWVRDQLLEQVSDVPPFPVSAVVLGLGVSIGVGVLAGVIPAVVASRIKIIDAIRY